MSNIDYFTSSSATGGPRVNPLRLYVHSGYQGDMVSLNELPVVRAGVVNRAFALPVTSSVLTSAITLKNVLTGVTIATINPNTVLATGTGQTWVNAWYYDSTDQALWVIVYNSSNVFQLAKINDTTGAVTPVGPTFTTTTPSNWTNTTSHFIEKVSGEILLTALGKRLTLNATTGAVMTQDVSVVLNGISVVYVSPSGNQALNSNVISNIPYSRDIQISFVTSSYFWNRKIISYDQMFSGVNTGTTSSNAARLIALDSDKIAILSAGVGAGAIYCWSIYYRSDFDRWLEDLDNLTYAFGG